MDAHFIIVERSSPSGYGNLSSQISASDPSKLVGDYGHSAEQNTQMHTKLLLHVESFKFYLRQEGGVTEIL